MFSESHDGDLFGPVERGRRREGREKERGGGTGGKEREWILETKGAGIKSFPPMNFNTQGVTVSLPWGAISLDYHHLRGGAQTQTTKACAVTDHLSRYDPVGVSISNLVDMQFAE